MEWKKTTYRQNEKEEKGKERRKVMEKDKWKVRGRKRQMDTEKRERDQELGYENKRERNRARWLEDDRWRAEKKRGSERESSEIMGREIEDRLNKHTWREMEKKNVIFSFPNCIPRPKLNYKHGYTIPL